jgi:ornithine cyclodeaminase/alanine dehydrogenase-like protein (mu-crystallin family)
MSKSRATVRNGDGMLVLSSADIRRLIPMREAIDTAREAFIAVSRSLVIQPARMSVADGSTLIMFAQGARSDAVVKIVSIRPGNPELGLASLQVVVLALDEATGQLKAVIDGSSLTALRTGAASGLATDMLASPDAHVLAMIGAGAQAADQVLAVCSVRPISELRIASLHGSSAHRLIDELAPSLEGVTCHAAASAREAVADADIICTATTASVPLFDVSDVKDTVHINAVGAHRANMCELAPGLLQHASVLAVDHVEAALSEAGDIIQALNSRHILKTDLMEIGVLLEQVPPPDRGRGLTVFKSVGVAAQDWALVRRVLDRAGAGGRPAEFST